MTQEPETLEFGSRDPIRSQSRCRVLVVEDDHDLRTSIREVFLMRGFLVNVARDGKEALDLASGEDYDVVVTDVRMPRMDGIRLSRLLPVFTNKPRVIIMTAYPQWEVAEDARALGAAEVLIKPLNLDELAETVRRVANLDS